MSAPSICVFDSAEVAVRELAGELSELIRSRAAEGRMAVLGLATGATPLPLYQELSRLHHQGLSFANVISFNLDEYLGLARDHAESYWTFMHRNLFDHIDMPESNIHLPSGVLPEAAIPAHCTEYEARIRDAGGLDFQLLGIGGTGHIGFNEPGSPRDSRTRRVLLDEMTRCDAAPAFGGVCQVPTQAITMGCGTILEARRIVLLAWGERKAAIVNTALNGPLTEQVSASFLQEHPNTSFYLDHGAASALESVPSPCGSTVTLPRRACVPG
ncbi:MAG: glucosamine-6-phosphate deaminase [Verrucomicrobia bacterium]|nr:MAG: glucosamine-6-phosphate deaminase [Verrucomicrobiota bacterium]